MGAFDFLKKQELEEIKRLKSEIEKLAPLKELDIELNSKRKELTGVENDIAELKEKYKKGLETFKALEKEIEVYNGKLDIIESGLYQPVFSFEKSSQYELEIEKIYNQQKNMISEGTAAVCSTNWYIENSLAKGKAHTKRYIKLVLRAFNGECDSVISKTKWNNINQMIERIKKSFETINEISKLQYVTIQHEYLDLKIKELQLEYEYQLKKQEEKQALKAAQEEIREEEKARREYEQALKDAETKESNYQKAIEKAQKEFNESTGEKHDALLAQIQKLEKELKEIQEKKERAISMAQLTKRGHVYVISNIGSFGENVYKIGMTRRLEPTDRVKELGDASVPFQFDIHAMIYSDEARTLEYELHKAFSDRKINMMNYRKEFFNVTLEEIENKIKELGFNAEFIKLPEAMEFRESQLIKSTPDKLNEIINSQPESIFPEDLLE